jgi:hypothetical protein
VKSLQENVVDAVRQANRVPELEEELLSLRADIGSLIRMIRFLSPKPENVCGPVVHHFDRQLSEWTLKELTK